MSIDTLGETLTFNVQFHNTPYNVIVDTHHQRLVLEVIQSTSPTVKWIGEFSAKYIEDYTKKAGSRKSFTVFVDMLKAALTHSSESVYLDLLTPEDLDRLKQARGQPVADKSAERKDRRYLILTYASQFDRVHYPLPLIPSSQSTVTPPSTTVARPQKSPSESLWKKKYESKVTEMEKLSEANRSKTRKIREQETEIRNLRQELKRWRLYLKKNVSELTKLQKPHAESLLPKDLPQQPENVRLSALVRLLQVIDQCQLHVSARHHFPDLTQQHGLKIKKKRSPNHVEIHLLVQLPVLPLDPLQELVPDLPQHRGPGAVELKRQREDHIQLIGVGISLGMILLFKNDWMDFRRF
ncbi:hypothetical protein GEMRC1_007657 [Eukaryota sp. GEM-RC1]